MNWLRFSNPLEWRSAGPSPLAYPRSSEVRRFSLVDTESTSESEMYFTPMTVKEMGGKKKHMAGAEPGTIGWIDWHPTSALATNDTIYIDFMVVRRGRRGQGAGWLIVEAFYEDVVLPSGATGVDWGDVVSDAAWKLYEKTRAAYPNLHHRGKLR